MNGGRFKRWRRRARPCTAANTPALLATAVPSVAAASRRPSKSWRPSIPSSSRVWNKLSLFIIEIYRPSSKSSGSWVRLDRTFRFLLSSSFVDIREGFDVWSQEDSAAPARLFCGVATLHFRREIVWSWTPLGADADNRTGDVSIEKLPAFFKSSFFITNLVFDSV